MNLHYSAAAVVWLSRFVRLTIVVISPSPGNDCRKVLVEVVEKVVCKNVYGISGLHGMEIRHGGYRPDLLL